MSYLFEAALAWSMVYFFVDRRVSGLWKAGLIGVAVAVVTDYFGTKYNFYAFTGGIIYLGRLPLLHVIGMYPWTLLYLNWLPGRWTKRVMYNAYLSAIFLAVEAVMHSAGAIVYPNWKIWYSYFLIFWGLVLTAYLSDFVISGERPRTFPD